eukprot:1187032-Prorocentrum_minimum.AAC.5
MEEKSGGFLIEEKLINDHGTCSLTTTAAAAVTTRCLSCTRVCAELDVKWELDRIGMDRRAKAARAGALHASPINVD